MAKPNSWGDPIPNTFPGDLQYPGGDPLLTKYHLQILNDAGYLNIGNSSLEEKIKPHDKEAWASSSADPNPNAIHPMLRQARWSDIDDTDFERLAPVLRLTSCFLGEPCIMPFFAGLKRSKPLNHPEGEALFKNQTLYWFDLYKPDEQSAGHIPCSLEAWKFLAEEMVPLVTFRLGENTPGTYASTHLQFDRPGDMEGTWGSEIRLAPSYLEVFRKKHPGDMPYKKYIVHEPAMLRTTVHMAMAILHELAHAVVFATMPWTEAQHKTMKPAPAEPFFQNDRIQEVGLAFQQYLFDGVLAPNGPKLLTSCMYGLHMYDFPGAVHKPPDTVKIYELQTPKDVGLDEEWHYAVHMSWVRKFMTTEFWEHAALRDEPNSAFKYRRTEYKASRRVIYTSDAASTTTPAIPKTTPVVPKITPAVPKIIPAVPKIIPAVPKIIPAVPKIIPAVPKIIPTVPKIIPAVPKITPAATKTSPAASTATASTATPAATKPTKIPPPGPPTTTGPTAPTAPAVASGTEGGWTEVSSKRKNKDNAGRGGKKTRG